MAATSSMDAGARRGPHPLALAYLTFFILLIVAGAGITFFGNPHAGDSVVSIDLPSPAAKPKFAAKPAAAAAPQTAAPTQGLTDQAQIPQTASQPVTQQVYSGRALIADPSLVENTPMGPLPRIADDGTTPMRAYAPPAISDGHPRIAIVIGGLGISAKQTDAALKGLPAGVTLAVAPYAGDAQHWVSQARAQGHEVLLEVPMEPYDFPDSDPGPHTLRSGAGEDANTERLVWALTRFSGYAGITNLLGGRFMSDANSLEPMLTYLARRGLMFYDNGQATHSAAADVAGRVGVPFAQADSEIDTIQTAMEIDRRLSALESSARARGFAAGSGGLTPITIDRVRIWAQGLSGRGFVLVPASAIVTQSK
ncbi:MAG TPA: divergent polysaccharide deacetylase family protein [Rhizomicrobium sp.]|nr:divergent polysaccharide deacetylase family protein [Rhizomicrobium sp.]